MHLQKKGQSGPVLRPKAPCYGKKRVRFHAPAVCTADGRIFPEPTSSQRKPKNLCSNIWKPLQSAFIIEADKTPKSRIAMEAEKPIVDANVLAALETYAPAAAAYLIEETYYLSQWDGVAEDVDALWGDGFQPIALLIHGFVFADWNEEISELQEVVARLERKGGFYDPSDDEQMKAVMRSMRDLHNMRHAGRESLCIISELVKRAVIDGDLVARYWKPPYFPVENRARFGFDAWLNEDLVKGRNGDSPLWAILPDARLVVSLEQVNKWLTKIGVEIPSCYQLSADGKVNAKSKLRALTYARERQINTLLQIIEKLGYSPDNIPKSDKKIKGEVKSEALTKEFRRIEFDEHSFRCTWDDMRKREIIKG